MKTILFFLLVLIQHSLFSQISIPPTLAKDTTWKKYFIISDSGLTVIPDSVNPSFFIKNKTFDHFRHSANHPCSFDTLIAGQHNVNRCDSLGELYSKSRILDSVSDSSPLKGIRIALDPGHMAGDLKMAKVEDKYIDFKVDNKPVSLYEARLTWCTTQILKQKLEQAGATVFITVKKHGLAAINKTFDEWLKQDYKRHLDSLIKLERFPKRKRSYYLKLRSRNTHLGRKMMYHRIFKYIDYQARARKINAFKPDLSIIIHYNVDSDNKNWLKPTSQNACMTFVPGAFMDGELNNEQDQAEFLRLMITDDLNQSVTLSNAIAEEFESGLKVPLAKDTSKIDYLSKYCLPTKAPGVYSRNLVLTRLVHGPLCYGETLYQDNLKESVALSAQNLEIGKTGCNVRTQEVAEAYYKGIIKYIKLITQ